MDNFDDRIVILLQEDGRLSYTELAARTGLPRTAVTARVEALISNGALRIVAAPHPEFVGLTSIAHISIQTSGRSDELVTLLTSWPSVVLVLAVAGVHDLVVEARLPNQRELHATVTAISELPSVTAVNTLIYVEVLKGIFMPHHALAEGVTVDEKDIELIQQLQDDGRMSYRDLAAQVGLSPSAVRQRVVELLADNVIRIGATINRSRQTPTVACGVGLNLNGEGKELLQHLKASPRVEFLAQTIGRFDAVTAVAADSTSQLRQFLQAIKAHSSVQKTEIWTHLEVFKERYEWPKATAAPSAR
jgi:DNA-binding Lrp family transcriptional regulator